MTGGGRSAAHASRCYTCTIAERGKARGETQVAHTMGDVGVVKLPVHLVWNAHACAAVPMGCASRQVCERMNADDARKNRAQRWL